MLGETALFLHCKTSFPLPLAKFESYIVLLSMTKHICLNGERYWLMNQEIKILCSFSFISTGRGKNPSQKRERQIDCNNDLSLKLQWCVRSQQGDKTPLLIGRTNVTWCSWSVFIHKVLCLVIGIKILAVTENRTDWG